MDLSPYITRKVILGAGAVFLMAATWVACQWFTKAAENYGTFVTGLTALYATYCGANTLQDHILKNKEKPASKPPVEPVPPEDK